MSIIQQHYFINSREFVRTYSDSGRYVIGGSPEGNYTEANDPAEFNRTYVEGDLIPFDENEPDAEEIANILLGNS